VQTDALVVASSPPTSGAMVEFDDDEPCPEPEVRRSTWGSSRRCCESDDLGLATGTAKHQARRFGLGLGLGLKLRLG
jgi:hypothetical protein